MDELVALAQHFQAAPQLRVDPTFAALLERRMLRHSADAVVRGRSSALQSNARQGLRGFLPRLESPASLATTTELGRLGEQIPQLRSATLILPVHPRGSATIRITGSGVQPGAQLLVNGKPIRVSGTLQDGQIVFVLTWNSEQHPHSLGILNPDGTAAQTSSLTITKANEKSSGKGNGNGTCGGKPEVTPTPQ